MTIGFPPQPVYPNAIDSDFTLYLVHNTSEAVLAADSEAWAMEIEIVPVGASELEIWSDNGFANIDGELFYYDSVEKDSNDKVFKFLRCARNLGGVDTHYVKADGRLKVRGFVVAEHHNQLVQAILQLENFVGINFDTDEETLDFRIRCLRDVPLVIDDFNCPSIIFNVEELSNDSSGIVISYDVLIDGTFNEFQIDFGDGETTTSTVSGTHTYAPGSIVDPVVRIANDNCQQVQTPIIRTTVATNFDLTPTDPFTLPIPSVPPFPDFSCTPVVIPLPQIELPPIVFPCTDISVPPFPEISIPNIDIGDVNISIPDININVPSIIQIVPPIPSTINIEPPIPSVISFAEPFPSIPSVISFGPVDIPSEISVIDDIPSTISVIHDIPSIISAVATVEVSVTGVPTVISVIDTIPSIISVIDTIPDVISFANPPTISIDWGTPPELSCIVIVSCNTASAAAVGVRSMGNLPSDDSFSLDVDFGNLGIPSEVKVITPETLKVELENNIPKQINLDASSLPETIALEHDLPDSIILDAPESIALKVPDKITLDAPESIKLDVPQSIKLDTSEVAPLTLAVPDDFPSSIKLEMLGIPTTIQVVGMSDTIQVEHDIPTEIPLVMPENPQVEMIYKGDPVEFKIDIASNLIADGDGGQCVKIVPCNPSK